MGRIILVRKIIDGPFPLKLENLNSILLVMPSCRLLVIVINSTLQDQGKKLPPNPIIININRFKYMNIFMIMQSYASIFQFTF